MPDRKPTVRVIVGNDTDLQERPSEQGSAQSNGRRSSRRGSQRSADPLGVDIQLQESEKEDEPETATAQKSHKTEPSSQSSDEPAAAKQKSRKSKRNSQSSDDEPDTAERKSGGSQSGDEPAGFAVAFAADTDAAGELKSSKSRKTVREQLDDMQEYDATLDRVTDGQKYNYRCRMLVVLNSLVEKLPFPCGIRPLPCIRRSGWCFRIFEANRVCFFLARQGSGFLGHIRKLILIVTLLFTMQSMILRGLPAAALNTDDGNLESYPWAYGDYKCMNLDSCAGLEARMMIGLTSLLVISDNLNLRKSIPWNDPQCVEHLTTLGAGEYCGICRDASLGCAAVAFVSLSTGLVNFFTDIQRMRARNDHNCIKNLAVISNIIGAIQQVCAVSIFHGLCVAEFPREDAGKNFRLELRMGGGGALLASAASLNLFGIIVHWLIPVPEARWRVYGDITSPDPAAGEWPSLSGKKTKSLRSSASSRSVAPFDSPVPDGALAERDVVEGSGPGWEQEGQIMTRRSSAAEMIQRASRVVADVLSMENISKGSRDSLGSNTSKKSVLSRLSEKLSGSRNKKPGSG